MVVDEHQLFRPPASLTDEEVALIEPAAIAVHAVLRAVPQPGDRVLVLGCGVIGLLVLQALRAIAPESDVTAFARHAFQADLARKVPGCEVYIGGDGFRIAQEKTGAKLYRSRIGGAMLLGGFDHVFDCIGTSSTLTQALRWVRAAGTVVMVGIQFQPYKTDLSPLYFQEVGLLGSWGYGREAWQGEDIETFPLAARMVEKQELKLDGLVTHRFPLTHWRDAVAAAADKKDHRSVKVAITA